jgi:hypothetical protein
MGKGYLARCRARINLGILLGGEDSPPGATGRTALDSGDTDVVTVRVPFSQLPAADLQVGAVYEGGTRGSTGDDPLARLLPCGNQGGFRFKGERKTHAYRIALLYTSGVDPDWPDSLDVETGVFTYFGRQQKARGESPRYAARRQ